MLRAELAGRDALARALAVEVPDAWPPELYDADAIEWTLRALGDRHDGGPFGFYYFILRRDAHGASTNGTLIGAGGFKGPPDARGAVEIGYSVLAAYQRRGYASEAVRAWLALAFADPRVQLVVGQTLEGLVPSIGVLERAGFSYAGDGDDAGGPEGERVIRYELARADYASGRTPR